MTVIIFKKKNSEKVKTLTNIVEMHKLTRKKQILLIDINHSRFIFDSTSYKTETHM